MVFVDDQMYENGISAEEGVHLKEPFYTQKAQPHNKLFKIA